MRAKRDLEAARREAEDAQAGFVEAVGGLGSAAGSAKTEATGTAKRFAPVAAGIAGAAVVVTALRRLR